MEIIVQWLDDLEDFVCSLALTWERQRLRLLQAGLASALIVLAIELANILTPLAPTFASAALGSVGIWLAGSVVARFLRPQHVSAPSPGQSNA